jgi:phosphodiesterase/alkaline phosphatase D-like protein
MPKVRRMNLKTRTSSVERRRFLEYTWRGVGASLSLALVPADALFGAPRFRSNPFTLGVASGDPTPKDWPNGHYVAYRDMVDNDLDLVLHLGDYTYEYAIGATTGRAAFRLRTVSARRRSTCERIACGIRSTNSTRILVLE